MKKILALGLVAVCSLGILVGCGNDMEVTRNTVHIQEDGTVTEGIVEVFDKSYYSEEELQTFIDETVSQYTETHGKSSVKYSGFKVEEGTSYLTMSYDSVENYVLFNNVELFSGTVAEAINSGYDFSPQFFEITETGVGEQVAANEVKQAADLKIVITNQPIDVVVDGSLKYVGAEDVKVLSTTKVSINEPAEGQTLKPVYIIYE